MCSCYKVAGFLFNLPKQATRLGTLDVMLHTVSFNLNSSLFCNISQLRCIICSAQFCCYRNAEMHSVLCCVLYIITSARACPVLLLQKCSSSWSVQASTLSFICALLCFATTDNFFAFSAPFCLAVAAAAVQSPTFSFICAATVSFAVSSALLCLAAAV